MGDKQAEISAMNAVAAALDKLDDDAIIRVFRWAASAYEIPHDIISNRIHTTPSGTTAKREAPSDAPPGDQATSQRKPAEMKATRKGSEVRSTSKIRPKIVAQLNFRPSGKESLSDFAATRPTKSNQELATLITFYCIQILGLPSVNQDDVFSAFKFLNKRVPLDIPSLFRDIQRHKGWIDASDVLKVVMTNNGENFVEHDLPERKVISSN